MTNLELKTVISVMELADQALEYLDHCYDITDLCAESIISDSFRSYDLFKTLCGQLDYQCDIRGIAHKDDIDY